HSKEVVTDPAPGIRPDEPRADHDRANLNGGMRLSKAQRALEERRGPEGQRADRKGVGGITQDREDVRAVPDQGSIGGAYGAAERHGMGSPGRTVSGSLGAAGRGVQHQRQPREDQSWNTGHEELLAPAEVMIDQPAH